MALEANTTMVDFTDFILPHLQNVRPYVPGKPVKEVQRELGLTGEILKLASNENTLGPSPLAIEAIIDAGWFVEGQKVEAVGISAGASTPDFLVDEVIERLVEISGGQARVILPRKKSRIRKTVRSAK